MYMTFTLKSSLKACILSSDSSGFNMSLNTDLQDYFTDVEEEPVR